MQFTRRSRLKIYARCAPLDDDDSKFEECRKASFRRRDPPTKNKRFAIVECNMHLCFFGRLNGICKASSLAPIRCSIFSVLHFVFGSSGFDSVLLSGGGSYFTTQNGAICTMSKEVFCVSPWNSFLIIFSAFAHCAPAQSSSRAEGLAVD